MMLKQEGDNNIGLLALTASVLLHLLFFVQFINYSYGNQAQSPELSTRISLNFLSQPTPAPQPLEMIAPIHQAEDKIKPIAKKLKKTKPELKQIVPLVLEEQVVASIESENSLAGKEQAVAADRELYLDELANYIEASKYYPRIARARGIDGDIEVSFELLSNGEINFLKTSGGPGILREAAEASISRALPLPIPPETVQCPMQVSYVLQYQIR